MAGEIEELKALLAGTDTGDRFLQNEARLRFALSYATTKVNETRNYTGESYEPQYRLNVIQGAIDYLEQSGGSELASFSAYGVSGTRKEHPSWLAGIVPLARRVPR